MKCPKCLKKLDNYSTIEGGWCSRCKEWFPPDVVEEFIDEND